MRIASVDQLSNNVQPPLAPIGACMGFGWEIRAGVTEVRILRNDNAPGRRGKYRRCPIPSPLTAG